MALAPGTRLGAYEVTAQLGEGGMGEVYRARDTRLDRDVALKILPVSFAADPDRLMRFEREAKTLASLNHPNIAAIYGIEETGDTRALVMELVEGEDLFERLARGPIAFDEALPIARQVAEALEAAHEAGIIHRDLKPANIKVRGDGTVKVLDFGLAKALDPMASSSPDAANSPTMTSPALTQMGVILGTAAYMAPEQAKGRPVDRRADIWAFGAVLFEMLAGRRAFEGEDVSTTLAAVLMREPEWSALRGNLPPALQRLLHRCLERDARQRLRDIGEARVTLADMAAGTAEPQPAQSAATPQPAIWRQPLVWVLATVVGAAAFAAALWLRPPAPEARVMRFALATPGPSSPPLAVTVSPDGSRVAFVAADTDAVDSETGRIWVRALDSITATPLPGTEGARLPFWSPDGAFLGFFANDRLKKVPVAGGPITDICEAPQGAGGAWSGDTIIFAPGYNSALFRVPAIGGTPAPLTTLDPARSETSHRAPVFLPDGRHFLYVARRGFNNDEAMVSAASLDAPEDRTEVLPSGTPSSNALYAPPGYLLFLRGRTLVAQRFDAKTRLVSGETVTVAENVGTGSMALSGLFSVSQTGVLAHVEGRSAQGELVWVGRDGSELSRTSVTGGPELVGVRLSPDGTRAALARSTLGNLDIWTVDLTRTVLSRLTSDASPEEDPVWSPDGTHIAFTRAGPDGRMIVQRPWDGTGEEVLILRTNVALNAFDWSRDGQFLLCPDVDPVTKGDLYVLPLSGDRTLVPWLKTPASEGLARFSPDGRWITYQSDDSGRWEVYVESFQPSGRKTQISVDGGGFPQWRGDGRELVYYSLLNRQVMAVAMRDGAPVGPPKALFGRRLPVFGAVPFSMTEDGQRFLLYEQTGDATSPALSVVLNWTAIIKK